MSTSSAPIFTRSSITFAQFFFSIMLLTATQFSASSGLTVGAFLPGAIWVASRSLSREMLNWQTTYLFAAITPAIRFVMRSTSGVRCGRLGVVDRINTASVWRTVAIERRPAARIVSPDSIKALKEKLTLMWLILLTNKINCIRCASKDDEHKKSKIVNAPIPSAKPSAQAASTLPPTYSICVFLSPDNPSSLSNFPKNSPAMTSKLVTTRLPARSSTVLIEPASGAWTCREHFPNPSRSSSVTRFSIWASRITSCPVMPRSTLPLPTKEGMSDAGRKTLVKREHGCWNFL